jgi:DNA-binding beta-propeller fold protein YncE
MGRASSPIDRDAAGAKRPFAPLRAAGRIGIPNAGGSAFDHGAYDAVSGRVFIAHTARDCIEVIDPDDGRHLKTMGGFPGAAGVVADDGHVLVTNRGAASASLLNASTLTTLTTFKTGARPNGAALVMRKRLAIVACIGDDAEGPVLQRFDLDGTPRRSTALPGRPRWCATDAAAERLFLAIREPSMVLVLGLPELNILAQCKLPSGGAHGLDIDHRRGRIYVACDDGALVELDSSNGEICNSWPIAKSPDVTFFNPASGLVHVASGEPGQVETVDPQSGQYAAAATAAGAHTTVLVPPHRLYAISPRHGGILVLEDD